LTFSLLDSDWIAPADKSANGSLDLDHEVLILEQALEPAGEEALGPVMGTVTLNPLTLLPNTTAFCEIVKMHYIIYDINSNFAWTCTKVLGAHIQYHNVF
jgi:hypothetical protein